MALFRIVFLSSAVLVLFSFGIKATIVECEGESVTKTVKASKNGVAQASFCAESGQPPNSFAQLPVGDDYCSAHHDCAGGYFWWWEAKEPHHGIYTIHVQIRGLKEKQGGEFPITVFANRFSESLKLTVVVSDKAAGETESEAPAYNTPRIEECKESEAKAAASSSKKCPAGWLPFGDGFCVLNELGRPVNFQLAQESCATFGATLVKLDRVEDHWVRRRRSTDEDETDEEGDEIGDDDEEMDDDNEDEEIGDDDKDEDEFLDDGEEEDGDEEDDEDEEGEESEEKEPVEEDREEKMYGDDYVNDAAVEEDDEDEETSKDEESMEIKSGAEYEEKTYGEKEGDVKEDEKTTAAHEEEYDKGDFDERTAEREEEEKTAEREEEEKIEDLEDAEKEKSKEESNKDVKANAVQIERVFHGMQKGDRYTLDPCLNARLGFLAGNDNLWVMDEQDDLSCLAYNINTKVVQEERSCHYLYNKFTCVLDTRQYKKPTITKFQLQFHYADGGHEDVNLSVTKSATEYHQVKKGMTSVTISCEADGWPEPEVVIVEEAFGAQPQSLHSSPHQHNISVSAKGSFFLGKYGCVASNIFGDEVKIGDLQLWRSKPPGRVRLVVSGVMIMLLIILVILALFILNR
ncbi:hypothetical protein EGW08_019443, partial [Elysia chlorotica]